MAQAGNRVLVVDCDLRRPVLHKAFGLDRSPGLSNLLVGTGVDPQLFVQKTTQANLEVITCGPTPPNPPDLLGSKRMHALLESSRQDYKFIILDSPPLWAATDAAVLTSFVDGTLLVVKAGDTRRHFAQRAVKLLGDINAKIIGVVLNKMEAGKDGYYYYDYYYYQYGLSYRDKDEKKQSRWWKNGQREKGPIT
jgi:capsular exopolysaccharide synthesis family protein